MLTFRFLECTLAALAVCSHLQASNLDQAILSIQEALQRGDLNAATQLIDSCFKDHSHNGGLLNLRGILHAQRNELPAARADFEAAVQSAPGLMPAWQNLARACQIEAEHDSSSSACALNSWQHVERLELSNAEAHSSLARLYERQAKFSDSLREIKALPSPEAEQPENVLLRCAGLAGSGQEAEASAVASKLAQRSNFSEEQWNSVEGAFHSASSASVVVSLLKSLDKRRAAGAGSLRRLAVAYEQLGRSQEARETLERVAVLDPRNTAHLLELARLAEASKDYEGALGYLAHARDLEPDRAQIHYLFAMVATEMKLPVEAHASLQKALALDPENPAYNYAMGFVILSTRDAATAGSFFQKFVTAKPAMIKGHYALGIACFASGDYARAKQEMQRVETNPETAGGAEYFLGRIAKQEDDLARSEKYLRRSIELLPDFPESRTELARVLMLRKDFAEARTQLESAIRLDGQSFQANEQLLVLYRRTNDQRAEKQAELVKKLDEDRSKRAELMLRTIDARP